jgi:hypothetical protein
MEDRKDRDEQPALLELNHGWFVTAIRNLREERCRAELNPHLLSGELRFQHGWWRYSVVGVSFDSRTLSKSRYSRWRKLEKERGTVINFGNKKHPAMHQAQVQHHTWYCFTSCGTYIRLDICDKNIKKAIKNSN